jgi:hypothetical protein
MTQPFRHVRATGFRHKPANMLETQPEHPDNAP